MFNSYTSGNLALKTPLPLPYSFHFTPAESRVFRPRERLTVSQWAERHRIVTNGPMKGRWLNSTTPYLVEPMDCWNIPSIREIILCFAPQTGKTQVAFNCLAYSIDQDPGPAMYVMPDEKVTKRIARRRIIPMFRSSPRLAELLSPRADNTTTLAVNFKNGMDLMMAWATSAAELASEDVRYLILDETDKFPDFSGKEADPISLAKIRTNTYPFTKKILYTSTPANDPSNIANLLIYEADEVRVYAVPCPICGHVQIMDFEHISWPKNIHEPRQITRKKLARYSCDKCGMFWDDYMRDQAVKRGCWIPGTMNDKFEWMPADRPIVRPRAVGFYLPSWYSPFISLSEIVAAQIRGQEDYAKKMVFVTQHEAKPFEEAVESKTESQLLTHKTKLASAIVPANAIALTAGIDTHKNGFKFTVFAWEEDPNGLSFTVHKIHHGVLATLKDVEMLIFETRYQVENSQGTMGIWRAAIDTGGGALDEESTMTEEVYQWLRGVRPGTIFGVKGASHRQMNRVKLSTIDKFPHSNRPIPGGLELRILDVDQFKYLLHWRLGRSSEESQRIYLDADTGIDFAQEFLAEELIRDRRGHKKWKRIRSANHYLDCFDSETEILTKQGWLSVTDINSEHECATVNLGNDQIEYQKPLRLITREHHGEMVYINGRRINIMVTPNHRMVIYKKRYEGTRQQGKWIFETIPEIVLAKDLTIWDRIKLTAHWTGESIQNVCIPASFKQNQPWIQIEPERNISAEDMAEFLGWYVAEGYTAINIYGKNSIRRRVCIAQTNKDKIQLISQLLNRLPWNWHYSKSNHVFTITSKQLYDYIQWECPGKQEIRKIPQWIKDSSPKTIKCFFDAAILGDGWVQKNLKTYATVSKLLADDIQELFIKAGYSSNLKLVRAKPIKLKGVISNNTLNQYWVTECKTKTGHLRSWNNKPNFKTIPFDGMVYCVSVPNTTLICRREGKAFIAGNCSTYALACGDSEWMPSLKMLSTHIKQLRAKNGEPRAKSKEQGMENQEQRAEGRGQGKRGFERPDMEKMREKLSDRFNR